MTVTINYTAFLLTIVAGVGIAALVYLIIVLARLNRTLARIDPVIDRVDAVLGSIHTLAEEATVTVVSARHLVEEGNRLVNDCSAISARLRELAAGGEGRTLTLVDRIKTYVAIFAGVKTALASVKHFMERRRHGTAQETDR
jgi:hypothetical protein